MICRMGPNQFSWISKPDILKTLNKDILMRVPPPIPLSSRYLGLSNKVLDQVEKLFRVGVVVELMANNCRHLKKFVF